MKLALGVLLLAAAAPSPEIRYFQYERPVLHTPSHAGQACLVLSAELLSHAAPELADVRLYGNDVEVPWVLHLVAPQEAAEKTILPLNLGLRAGETVFDAALPEGSYSDLQLDVTAHDFIATVTVSGSRTEGASLATSPATELGAYTIFDLTRQRLGRSTVLHLPKSDFPFLHFQLTDPIRPENITGISVSQIASNPPQYESVAQSSHITRKGHASILEFTVPAHVPVDRIAFSPATRPENFSRNVTIAVMAEIPASANDRTGPSIPITTSGNLLRIHTTQNGHRLNEEHLAIDTPGTNFDTAQKWTITIDNGDDAPLSLQTVDLEMQQRSLCFESSENAHYALYYGDPALTAPRYDYASLFTPQADAAQAAAGPELHNPQYQPRPDGRPFSEKHPALLWTALVLVVALLGFIALRSAKRTPSP